MQSVHSNICRSTLAPSAAFPIACPQRAEQNGRQASGRRILVGAVGAALLVNCSLISSIGGPANDALKLSGGCPDLGSIEAIAKIDFAKEFSMDAAVGAKVKAGTIAASDLSAIAAAIDGDLKSGCSGLAKDLGAPSDFKSGTDACQAAVEAMGNMRAKMGGKASVGVQVKPPVCSASIDAVADCAGKCDATVAGGKAEVKCEGGELSGTCSGECTGKCELSAAAACSGKCGGSCDASFSGTCGGTCNGKCNGKSSNATCHGKCEGTCDANASGTCGGKCQGSCEPNGAAQCDGTCNGKCSVEWKEPHCSGHLVPPQMSADCKATCDAHGAAHMACTKPSIAVNITGFADATAAAQYKAALEANLPHIVRIALGMGSKLKDIVADGKTTIEGAITAGQAVVKGRPTAAPHVTACLLKPFTGAIESVANIQADVKVSIDVNASASTSKSAS